MRTTKPYTVCLDGKCGYADGAGNVVIPSRFEAPNPFVDGRPWGRENGLIGVIDFFLSFRNLECFWRILIFTNQGGIHAP